MPETAQTVADLLAIHLEQIGSPYPHGARHRLTGDRLVTTIVRDEHLPHPLRRAHTIARHLDHSPHGWTARATAGGGSDPDTAHVTVTCGPRGWTDGGDGTRLPVHDVDKVRASLVYDVPAGAFTTGPESATRSTRARVHAELRRVLEQGGTLWALPGGIVAVEHDGTQVLLRPADRTTVVGGDDGDYMPGAAITLTHDMTAIREQPHYRIDLADGGSWKRTRDDEPDILTGREVARLITDLMKNRPRGGATVEGGIVYIAWGRGTQAARYVPVDAIGTGTKLADHPGFRPNGRYSEYSICPDGTEGTTPRTVTGRDVALEADAATELLVIDSAGEIDTRTTHRQGKTIRRRYRPFA
ncbi:hypothetical protein B4N89_44770 [Embleya scabrispora]|uniref:Uncharacterized protein n=1 Tax=Embleya scabrispora TaxID=159449 RepID=A0A1T3NIJ5_9ACTN|nr:hypothetical protein [Embleya scabrispora]OPC76608.1 hypothetical protein B4N89_44770 [Embleya scabrispora]